MPDAGLFCRFRAGRSTRTPFTASDRKKIFNIMWAVAGLQMERYAGNTAFQILEQKYPWHSWHSWRDHWLRQMQPYLAGIFDELLPQDSPMPEDEEALELATEIGHHLLGLLKPARVSPSMEYPTPKNSSTRLAPRLYLKEIVRTPEGWKSRKLSDMAARTPIKVSGPPPRAYSVASDSDSEPEEVAWNPDPKRRLSYGVERTAKKRVREISPVREDWDQDWTGGEFDFLREPEVSRWTQETPSSNPFTAPSLVEKSTSPKGKEKDRYIEGWEPESDLELQDSAESYVVDSAEETE